MIALAAPAFPWPGPQNPQQPFATLTPPPGLVLKSQRLVFWRHTSPKRSWGGSLFLGAAGAVSCTHCLQAIPAEDPGAFGQQIFVAVAYLAAHSDHRGLAGVKQLR